MCSLGFALDKQSELYSIWSVLSERLSYVVETIPTNISCNLSKDHSFKKWKAIQTLYDASNCNSSCRDNDDKYYDLNMG